MPADWREEMAALYSAADIMVVTPYRDGMNLVAKEYVTVQAATEGTGVLVLSEFAGAIEDIEVSANVCRAYNRWLADYCKPYPDRLFGIANESGLAQALNGSSLPRLRSFGGCLHAGGPGAGGQPMLGRAGVHVFSSCACIQAACLGARRVWFHSCSMSHFTSSRRRYMSGVPTSAASSSRWPLGSKK